MIYLNNAASSFPKPQSVYEAVNRCLQSPALHSSRIGFELQSRDILCECRQNLARLINTDLPNNIVFTSGATESLNLAIRGADLSEGHVITTATEHNSVLRPLMTMEKEGIIELSIIGCDTNGFVDPRQIDSSIRNETRAIVVNHCSNVTGAIQDLKKISEIAESAKALFIVDASQSAGIVPIDVKTCKIDMLALTGHKSLYGIPGIGCLYLRQGLEFEIKPLKVGGTGVKSRLLSQPKEMPLYYEAGTQNLPGITALNEGIEFVLQTGLKVLKEAKEAFCSRILHEFEQEDNIVVYGQSDPENNSGIISFNIKGLSPADTGYLLENSFGIIVRSGLHCAPLIHKALGSYPQGSIRISPSYFTTDQEIETFINAVKQTCMAGAAL